MNFFVVILFILYCLHLVFNFCDLNLGNEKIKNEHRIAVSSAQCILLLFKEKVYLKQKKNYDKLVYVLKNELRL
jgi:hypothetical protein